MDNLKIIDLNLSNRNIDYLDLDSKVVHSYLGGSGLSVYYMLTRKDYNNKPLSQESMLCVFPGLLTGRVIPTASRTSFCARSPLTGVWNESTVGGYFGAHFKQTGWDGLIITGASDTWCYLIISHKGIVVKNADHLIGLDTYETSEMIKREINVNAEVACIGRAGENCINISSVVIGGHSARLAARGGIGAVLGSKKIKAIVIDGHGQLKNSQPDLLKQSIGDLFKIAQVKLKRMRDYGTAGSFEAKEASGDLPIHNWLGNNWPSANKICGQEIDRIYKPKKYACWSCSIGCGKIVSIESGEVHSPEYETLAAFGSMCEISDIESIIVCNDLCNREGIDTISAGSAVAFAMEANEAGILPNIDDLNIKWGSSKTLKDLIVAIAKKEGIGELLGKGTYAAAKEIGKGAEDLAVTCKGMEVAMHDPRAFTSQALGYAIGPRGGCHLEANSHGIESGLSIPEIGIDRSYIPTSSDGKAELCMIMQDLMSIYNALGLCKFLMNTGCGVQKIVEWVNYSIGFDMKLEELMKTGSRIFNAKRLYNFATKSEHNNDRLPMRLLENPKNIRGVNNMIEFDLLLKEYYELRHWNSYGQPDSQLLNDLDLSSFNNFL